jgi:hypothetical protein
MWMPTITFLSRTSAWKNVRVVAFIQPDKEESYLTAWGATADAVEYAKLLVKRFNDLQALTPSRPGQA